MVPAGEEEERAGCEAKADSSSEAHELRACQRGLRAVARMLTVSMLIGGVDCRQGGGNRGKEVQGEDGG